MFMRPEFIAGAGYSVETTHGTEFIPEDVCGPAHTTEDIADYIAGDTFGQFTLVRVSGVFWRLSAPGYMDCTDWSFAETLREAVEDCQDMFGDDEELDQELTQILVDIDISE